MRRSTTFAYVVLLALGVTLIPAGPAAADEPLLALGPVARTEGFERDLATLDTQESYGAFVHFLGGGLVEHTKLLAGLSLDVLIKYPHFGAYYVVGTVGDFRVLTWEPAVSYLEDDQRIFYHGDTGVWASRARVAQEAVAGGPYRDAYGKILDGSGVGVAVIDSGINGAHPDLTNRIGKNFKVVCPLINATTERCFSAATIVDVGRSASSDTTSGHGTHVAGIVAGDGTASTGAFSGARPNVKGTFTGVAPGATLYGFGTGEGDRIFFATQALAYIYDNFDTFAPRIRVINNSYGDGNGSAYDPNTVFSKLVKALVEEKGVTVTFSASNLAVGETRTGTEDQTSGFSKDPTPGVISVANYDDNDPDAEDEGPVGHGNRNGTLDASSSGGLAGSPTTYPDISAPGAFITSTCVREVQPICNAGIVDEARWAPWYASISGTSMASPHIAGVAALMYQAVPATPGAIEDVLQDTAHKFSGGGLYTPDPQNGSGATTSYDKGAGLVDVANALDALDVAHAAGGAEGTPLVHIATPAEGADLDGTGTIVVSGTADDGTVPPVVPQQQLIFDGESGDFAGPGAADIVALSVQETAAGVVPAGITYAITVRNAADFGGAPASAAISLRITQNVNGRNFLSQVSTTPTAVTVSTSSTATPTSVSRVGNVISFFVPFTNLGNPAAGSIGHNVFASSFIGGIVDLAPSPQDNQSNAAADVNGRPMFGRPYSIVRPEVTPPPSVDVKISLDGGLPTSTSVTGSSPNYDWSTSINGTSLANGAHTLLATLFLNGFPSATHSVSFTVTRILPEFVYQVNLTSPADGATVPRAVVLVEGTSFTDDPTTPRAVVLEVTSPLYSSGERTATGESPWTVEFDFSSLAAGPYTLTARLKVAGATKATSSVGVVVPVNTEVACSPRNIDFWRGQFRKNSDSLRFTAAEADTLAARAVALSDGYFANTNKLITALNAGGQQPEKAAARQYASLLLNLAAGDLAGNMSYRAGLSGREGLDPDVYAVSVVGSTVDAAATWMRAQFPDRTDGGNLGGVNEVANAINNGQGLVC